MTPTGRPLSDAHHGFASALFDPDRPAPAGLLARTGADIQRRFGVHRNNVVVTLTDVLAATFPVTQALVGEDFFRAMARDHVRASPPRSPVLAEYGAGFAGFIARFAPAAGLPYLPDMARLEWACLRAFHAEDAVAVDVADFHALLDTPGRAGTTRLELHPAAHWLRSDHAIVSLWSAHQGLDDMRQADLGGIDLDRAEDALITRPHEDVHVSALPDGGTRWLDDLRAGMPLGDALTRCRDEAQLRSLLTLTLHQQLTIALHPQPEPTA